MLGRFQHTRHCLPILSEVVDGCEQCVEKKYAVPKYENTFLGEKFGENDLGAMNTNIFIKKYFAYLSCLKG